MGHLGHGENGEVMASSGKNIVSVNHVTVGGLPTGAMTAFAGAVGTIPAGWLPCDGSEYDETVQAALFAVIGSVFNTGGETPGFFRVPDTRAKVLAGVNDGTGAGSTRALGEAVGSETHAHAVNSHSHPIPTENGGYNDGSVLGGGTGLGLAGGNSNIHNHPHNHGGSTSNASGSTNSQSTIQPTIHLNQIIKT